MSHKRNILYLWFFLLLICFFSIFTLGCENKKQKAKEHYQRGLAYYEQENKREAFQEFEKAIALDPDLADAHFKLGVMYHGGSSYDKSIESFKKVLSLDPNYPRIFVGLGNVYYEYGLKKWVAAIKVSLKYMFQDTLSAPVYKSEEEYQKGIEEANTALAQNPEDGDALSKLSFIYYSLAQDNYLKALEQDPADPMVHYGLGLVYSEKGYEQKALAEAEILKKLDPELSDVLTTEVEKKRQEKESFKTRIEEAKTKP